MAEALCNELWRVCVSDFIGGFLVKLRLRTCSCVGGVQPNLFSFLKKRETDVEQLGGIK